MIREMAKTTLTEIEKRCENPELIPGWKTKRYTLTVDDQTSAWRGGNDLFIIM